MAERANAFSDVSTHDAASIPASAPSADASTEETIQSLVEYDLDDGHLSWSSLAAAQRMLGDDQAHARQSLEDYERRITSLTHDERARALRGETQNYVCEYQLKSDLGATHWVEERGGWIAVGENRRLIGVVRSIEYQKRREKHLSWLATNDELTGLLNRSSLRAELDDVIEQLQEKGAEGAYLLVGIDDLGAINADFGFEVADAVICAVSERLKNVVGGQDLIGRYAGTKFGVIIRNADEARVRDVCIKMMNAVRADMIDTARGAISASVCVGAVLTPLDANNAQAAMPRAEAALDAARRLGPSSWSQFSEKTDQISRRRRNTHMSDVILTALNDRRVRLAFQPIVADIDEPPRKYECLIRIVAENGSEVPAPAFIPVAERLGLVHLLDRRVLELAINTLSVCPHISLAVNVSMETVKDPVWAEGYISHMRANRHLTPRITVELTETQVIDAIDASIEFVTEIKSLGATFAIDDFGAGYTSFRNLKALDIDILKIDGSFVTGVSSSRENQLFVRTLLDLARNFGMRTVAEWVDNEADAILLKGLGVDCLQGFLIGKPEVSPVWLPDGAPNHPPHAASR